jgi:hypothetical protein
MYKIKYTNFNKIGGIRDAEDMVLEENVTTGIEKTENENFLDDLEGFGLQMLDDLKNLDTPKNLKYIKNIITSIDEEFTINNSLNLTELYITFLGHVMSHFDNDLILGKIFDKEEYQLGLLFEHGKMHINEFTSTIQQLGELLKIASKEDFLPPIIEHYKQNEAYRILEFIYPNTSTDAYDYLLESIKKIFFDTDDDIFSWILSLESILGIVDVQDFLLQVSSPTITSNFENLLKAFVRNRYETFTESILSKRFQAGTNVQPGINVQMTDQAKLYYYQYIITYIVNLFNNNPYIQKVKDLPVVVSSNQNFNLYIENVSELIQQDRDSFFSGLLTTIPIWPLREGLKEILQMDESDIETVIDKNI